MTSPIGVSCGAENSGEGKEMESIIGVCCEAVGRGRRCIPNYEEVKEMGKRKVNCNN